MAISQGSIIDADDLSFVANIKRGTCTNSGTNVTIPGGQYTTVLVAAQSHAAATDGGSLYFLSRLDSYLTTTRIAGSRYAPVVSWVDYKTIKIKAYDGNGGEYCVIPLISKAWP